MELTKDIQQFLLRNIDSVAELEGLLLIRRENDTPWTADRLARRLYISDQAAESVLQALYRRGFLTRAANAQPQAAYNYSPHSDELRQTVDTLADLYSKYLIPITNLLHSKPSSAVQQFADAFRLREKD